MPSFSQPSRCSRGSSVRLRWYGVPSCELGDDFGATEAALFEAISRPGRVWSPYAAAMAKAEFRRRLVAATEGRLTPIDQVKPVDVRRPPPLYEIRWQGVTVTERDQAGRVTHGTALVRLYHSEPPEAPSFFIAHHAHEKLIDVPDVNAAQQVEIEIAVKLHDQGRPSGWGVAAPR